MGIDYYTVRHFSLQVDEVFLHGTLTDDEGRFKCEDIVKLLKYGEGNGET